MLGTLARGDARSAESNKPMRISKFKEADHITNLLNKVRGNGAYLSSGLGGCLLCDLQAFVEAGLLPRGFWAITDGVLVRGKSTKLIVST